MNTKIITDSSCDLSQEFINQYNIEILPIQLATVEGEDIHISTEEMFQKQREGSIFQTSQIGIYTYLQCFEKYAKKGQNFMYLSLSSGLTGGFNNSLVALQDIKEKYPEVSMASIDTKCASVGQGLFTYHMARVAAKGKAFEELLDLASFLREEMEHIFTVLDMEFLYQGGRVSRTQKNISQLLHLMPILKMNEEGKLYLHDIIRGKNKLNKTMLEMIRKDISGEEKADRILPVYGESLEEIEPFLNQLRKEGFLYLEPTQIGTIIGTHVGPNIIGAGYLKKNVPEKFYE